MRAMRAAARRPGGTLEFEQRQLQAGTQARLGARGVVRAGPNVLQVVVGPDVQS